MEEFVGAFSQDDRFQRRAEKRIKLSLSQRGKGLEKSKIRSVYWRLFLGCLDSKSTSAWASQVAKQRKRYSDLRDKFTIDPLAAKGGDLAVNNPLSQASNSPWQTYYKDAELTKTIQLDLDRTHPDRPFFQEPASQKMMLNVLFVWAKLNPEYSYRQGMNELLSPILWTLAQDACFHQGEVVAAATGTTATTQESGGAAAAAGDRLAREILRKDFVEHDCFVLFDRLMEGMKKYFAVQQRPEPSENKSKRGKPKETPIVLKCTELQDKYLRSVDPELYEHLKDEDIQPTLYFLRWVRLLFSREFHIDDVRTIWDHLLASRLVDGADLSAAMTDLPLMPHMCMAMCLYVRGELVHADNSNILRRLLRYPPVEDVLVLVRRASQLIRGGRESGTGTTPAPPGSPTREARGAKKKGGTNESRRGRRSDGKSRSGRRQKGSKSPVRRLKGFVNKVGTLFKKKKRETKVTLRKRISGLEQQLAQQEAQLGQMTKMAGILSSIAASLKDEVGKRSGDESADVKFVLTYVAQIVSVKDVLLGRMEADTVLDVHCAPDTPLQQETEMERDSEQERDPLGAAPAAASGEDDGKGGARADAGSGVGSDDEADSGAPPPQRDDANSAGGAEGSVNSDAEKGDASDGIVAGSTGGVREPSEGGRQVSSTGDKSQSAAVVAAVDKMTSDLFGDESDEDDVKAINEVKSALEKAGFGGTEDGDESDTLEDLLQQRAGVQQANARPAAASPATQIPIAAIKRKERSKEELAKKHEALLEDLLGDDEDTSANPGFADGVDDDDDIFG